MPDELRFPELARSLRSLGAARDAAGEAAHDAIFTDLLDARRRAAHSVGGQAIALFHGATLANAIDSAVAAAAAQGMQRPAVARARAAEARELLEPLFVALDALDEVAAVTGASEPSLPEWERWLAQLRRVFATADAACLGLSALLSQPTGEAGPSRWFGARRS